MAENLYDILGVKDTATTEEIRQAYRKLARKHHPDVNPGDQKAEDRFKRVAAAHDVLGDSDKRRAYDEFGEESLRGGFDPQKARDYQRWTEARSRGAAAVNRDGSRSDADFDLGEIFGWRRGGQIPLRGADIHATVSMDFHQAISGGEVRIDVPGGKPATVRIPPGADDGSTIRIAGRGGPGVGGGPPGNLVILTRVAPHPLLKRRGLDLHLTAPVTLNEAYNGAEIDVPTLDGLVKLHVPPLSQPGTKLRLRGKGVTRKKKRGDLIVTLNVRLPDKLNENLAKAIAETDEDYQEPVKRATRL